MRSRMQRAAAMPMLRSNKMRRASFCGSVKLWLGRGRRRVVILPRERSWTSVSRVSIYLNYIVNKIWLPSCVRPVNWQLRCPLSEPVLSCSPSPHRRVPSSPSRRSVHLGTESLFSGKMSNREFRRLRQLTIRSDLSTLIPRISGRWCVLARFTN